jgi:shikimate dehydrogenase
LGFPITHLEVQTSNLGNATQALRQLDVIGCGVTMPYKETIIPLLDQADTEVQTIGGCNCVEVREGRWIGHNTDGYGALAALREAAGDIDSLKSAVVVGAGGVARAIAHALSSQGLAVHVAARRIEQAQKLCDDLGLAGALDLGQQGSPVPDLVVNATPDANAKGAVRMESHPRASALLDVVVSPTPTGLVQQARERRMAVAEGWRMFLHLAARHVELWAGKPAPIRVLEAALRPNQRQ